MADRKPLDWESIEREYRAGQISIREIARQHGCSEKLIRNRASTERWARDLSQQVREAVRGELVIRGGDGAAVRTSIRTPSAREAVRTAVDRGVAVVREHIATAKRGHMVVRGLLGELEATAMSLSGIETEINDTMTGLQRISALQAISIAGRAKAALALASALDRLVSVERQAFSLDDPETKKPPPPPPADRAALVAELDRLGVLVHDGAEGAPENDGGA